MTTSEMVDFVLDRSHSRADIAREYAAHLGSQTMIWHAVNEAIMGRFSPTALRDIKRIAWDTLARVRGESEGGEG